MESKNPKIGGTGAGSSVTLTGTLREAFQIELTGDLEAAEQKYVTLLDSFSKSRKPCPLVLIHYLDFVRRSRGVEEARYLFEDLRAAESDHITPEVRVFVEIGFNWLYANSAVQKEQVIANLLQVLNGCTGKTQLEICLLVADFLAFGANDSRQALKEISRVLASRKNAIRILPLWELWDSILAEYSADVNATASEIKHWMSLHPVVPVDLANLKEEDVLHELVEAKKKVTDFSWFKTNPTALRMCTRFRVEGNLPRSAMLEQFLDMSTFKEDLRDGGNEDPVHIYRPDVTKLSRFVPSEDVQRKFEVPKPVKAFMACLPPKGPRSLNASTLAESTIRLLMSINLPRGATEELLANVDKRTRIAVEQLKKKETAGVAGAPMAAGGISAETKPKTKEELVDHEAAAKAVKKEEQVVDGQSNQAPVADSYRPPSRR